MHQTCSPLRLFCARIAAYPILAAFVLSGGCSTSNNRTDLPGAVSSTPSRFWISLAERAELEKKARDGDGESAFRLSVYYELSADDEAKAVYWLEVGASLDHLRSIHNLAWDLVGNERYRDLPRALVLIARATEIAIDQNDSETLLSLKLLSEALEDVEAQPGATDNPDDALRVREVH